MLNYMSSAFQGVVTLNGGKIAVTCFSEASAQAFIIVISTESCWQQANIEAQTKKYK